ncbi:MAG: type IV secretory system conjugative DNA transfer family protein, partial [Chloroflexota bacterium]
FISILKRRIRLQREQHASIVIDEMASTIGTMKEFVKEIGAELRKFGGSATLITQSYAQIPDDTIKEMKANYRTQIAFSGSPDDARIASGLFQEKVSAADIQALPRYHAYLLASIKGSQAAPCLIRCFPPAETPSEPEQVAWPYHPKWSFVLGQSDTTNGSLDDMLTLKQLEIGTRRQSRNQVMGVVDELLNQRQGWKKLNEIYWLKQEYDIWRAESLLQQPGLIPNTVERIEMLSRLRYGIPFWWSLAQYKHQYLDGAEQDDRRSVKRGKAPQKVVAQKEF